MRMTTKRAGVALGAALVALAILAQQASAVEAPFPRFARFYLTWFARAMDDCNPASLSVVGTNLPPGGCLQSNSTTDDMMTMRFARLIVSRRGRIGLLGVGFPFGGRVKVELALRVTRGELRTKHPPGSHKHVTFEDITIRCPNNLVGFVAGPRGVIAQATTLADCLGSASGLVTAPSNIEILDASLINVDNSNKVFAKPGILR